MKKLIVVIFVLGVIIAFSATVKFDFIGDFDLFVLDATPTKDISLSGMQVDVLFVSPGNVLMGFGVGYHTVGGSPSEFFSTDGTPVNVDHSLEIYSVASYRSELSSKFDLYIVSRGGMALPNHDFSLSGYFVEVSAEIVWFFDWFHIFGGASLKSYAFSNSTVTFIPLKVGIGGEY